MSQEIDLRMRRGAAASTLDEYLGEFLQKEENRIRAEAFQCLQEPSGLQPDHAVQLWSEYAILYRLISKMQADKRKGETAARQFAALTKQNP